MKDGKFIFTTVDPLNRQVSLRNDRWTEHIITKHGEVTPEVIRRNIENPRYIVVNVKPEYEGSDKLIIDEKRNDYIDLVVGKDNKLYVIKTIVEFEKPDQGIIITNYLLRRANEIKTMGGVIYDSSKDKSSK